MATPNDSPGIFCFWFFISVNARETELRERDLGSFAQALLNIRKGSTGAFPFWGVREREKSDCISSSLAPASRRQCHQAATPHVGVLETGSSRQDNIVCEAHITASEMRKAAWRSIGMEQDLESEALSVTLVSHSTSSPVFSLYVNCSDNDSMCTSQG